MFLHLKTAFFEPFQCRHRSKAYYFSILSICGFSFIHIFLAFYLAEKGFSHLTSFALTQLLLSGFVGFPALAWIIHHIRASFIMPVLLALQIIGLVGFTTLTSETPGWFIGTCFSLIANPFWIGYHTTMVLHTSDKNRGNEIATGSNAHNLGGIIGSLLAGLCLQYYDNITLLVIAGIFIITSTLHYTYYLSHHSLLKKNTSFNQNALSFFDEITTDPKRYCLSIVCGANDYITHFLLASWIKVMGLGGLIAGSARAWALLISILISPIAGHWVQKNTAKEITTGSILISAGWLPWILSSNPFLLTASPVLWSTGYHFLNAGEVARWYKSRTITAIACRESALSIGRSICVYCSAFVLFFTPNYYPYCGLLICGLLFATGLLLRNKQTL